MTTLKDMMVGDVQELFFALDDFGETHEVEGKEIELVPDNDTLQALKEVNLGLADATLLIYARMDDLPKRKAPGSFLNYDGRETLVVDWTENYGVAAIALSQSQTR